EQADWNERPEKRNVHRPESPAARPEFPRRTTERAPEKMRERPQAFVAAFETNLRHRQIGFGEQFLRSGKPKLDRQAVRRFTEGFAENGRKWKVDIPACRARSSRPAGS